jgi:2-keto-3-deoxy-6-phosphogluconate aldolase
MPAGLTPTEIYSAWQSGADVVKVFPCGAVGGASYIKAVKSVFPGIKLMATGGVNMDTIKGFLDAGAVAVGAGTDLVDTNLVKNRDAAGLAKRAKDFLEKLTDNCD